MALKLTLHREKSELRWIEMATEIQYDSFKSLYDEEAERYKSLAARAQLYFSIIAAYLGAIAFKFEDIQGFSRTWGVPAWMFLVTGALLLLALLGVVLAISIREYEGVYDPEGVIENFGAQPPTDSEFLDDRVIDLAVATKRNSEQNDWTAKCLKAAIILIFMGICFHFVIFARALFHH
jgi:hypothetical protein